MTSLIYIVSAVEVAASSQEVPLRFIDISSLRCEISPARGRERAMLIVKRRASMEREARNLSGGKQSMNG